MHRAAWIIVALSAVACGNKPGAPDGPGSASGSNPAPPRKHGPGLGRVDDGGSAYVTPPPVPADKLEKIGAVTAPVEDLAAITAGAFVMSGPPAEARKQSPWFLFDEDPATPYAQIGVGKDLPPIVIALSDRVEVTKIALDDQRDSLSEHIPAHIHLDASEDGTSWKPLVDGDIDLSPADDIKLLAKPGIPARFLRVSLVGSHAMQTKDGVQELQELRVYGKRTSNDPPPDATGTYKIDGVGVVHLTQTGSTVDGCIEGKQSRISGGFDGRVLRFWLTEKVDADSGPVVMTFGGGGRAFYGFWSGGMQAHSFLTVFDGTKTSDKAGKCPFDPKTDAIAADLAATGRARLYGVVFDLESEVLRDDAKPSLDRLVTILKAQPTLAFRIEAHTDAAATPPHNQILSAKQAVAVRQYLVAQGIDAKRITMKGMGATAAIAPNSTPLGRAHNRRVEIVKS